MKKIDKLVTRAFIGPFSVTLSVVLFIFLLRFILLYFEEIAGKDLGWLVYTKLYGYFTLIAVPIALPLAVLLASLMCFGNLGEYSELTAVKSAGISILRAFLPTSVVVFVVTIIAFWFNNTVMPWANLKGFSLLYDVKTTKATLNIKEGVFYKDIPGFSIKVSKRFGDNKTLKGLIIYDHKENNGNRRVILADSGQMYTIYNRKYLVFELFNGNQYSEYSENSSGSNQTQFLKNGFKHTKMVFSLDAFDMKRTEEERFGGHQIMQNIAQLSKTTDSLTRDLLKEKTQNINSMNSYYAYHLRKSPPIDSIKKAVKIGKWTTNLLASLSKNKDRQQKYETMKAATESAKSILTSLEAPIAVITAKEKDIRLTSIEWHRKFSQSIACFVLFLIGAPLGSIVKKGGLGVPVLLAIVFFIIYYILDINGLKWAKEGVTGIAIGIWMADSVLFLVGIYFLNQAKNDSILFDADAYRVFFDKLRTKFNSYDFLKKKQQTA